MRPQTARAVWALVIGGTVLRVVLAFTTDGQPYDISVLRGLRDVLDSAPRHVYETPIGPGEGIAWPYPPGFFPFAYLASVAADATGLAYTSLLRLPSIAADAGIALILWHVRRSVAAVALVALGPAFLVISGYHGQIDNLAILPAVAAVAYWDRWPVDRRALYAGLLIGAGCAIKTTPIFMVLALVPSVRSWREAGTLAGAAVAVPLLALAPYLATSAGDVVDALRYRGFPGTSGLSILLQPELAEQLTRAVTPSALVDFLYENGQLIVGAALVAVTAVTFRRPWEPAERATVLWLAFYVVTSVFFVQYLVWGLPFFLLAGHLRLAAAVQAIALVPTVLFYRAPWEDEAIAWPYGIFMVGLWALFAATLVRTVRSR